MTNPLLVDPRTEPVMLYRPGVEQKLEDLQDELDRLINELAGLEDTVAVEQANADQAGASPRGRMNKASPLRKAIEARDEVKKTCEDRAAEYDRLAQEAHDNRVKLVFREPSDDEYQEIRTDHPPRPKHAADQRVGHNVDTFPDALVRACLVEPAVTDEQWDEFRHGREADPDDPQGKPAVPGVSVFNWNKITNAVGELCNTEPTLPNPFAVSSLPRMIELASRRQRATGSRRPSSQG